MKAVDEFHEHSAWTLETAMLHLSERVARTAIPWTAEDEALLASLFRNAMPLETIATRLGRSRYAVELHLMKLGLDACEITAMRPR